MLSKKIIFLYRRMRKLAVLSGRVLFVFPREIPLRGVSYWIYRKWGLLYGYVSHTTWLYTFSHNEVIPFHLREDAINRVCALIKPIIPPAHNLNKYPSNRHSVNFLAKTNIFAILQCSMILYLILFLKCGRIDTTIDLILCQINLILSFGTKTLEKITSGYTPASPSGDPGSNSGLLRTWAEIVNLHLTPRVFVRVLHFPPPAKSPLSWFHLVVMQCS